MAIGKASDFVVYPEQFFGGVIETLEQNSEGFNAAAANTIRLVPAMKQGHYENESFIKALTSLVTRRDTTSVAAATDTALTQGEMVRVKLNRKIGPVAQTLDAFRKISMDPQEMSFILGQQTGKAIALDYLNTALNGLDAALSGVAAVNYDASANTSPSRAVLDHTNLVRGMAKFGDASNKLTAWVMHSKPFFDLMENTITDKIFEVASVTVFRGSVATFGRPVIVTDSPSLITTTSSATKYHTLGLVEDACRVEESEERQIVSDIITGLENLVMRVQGEYAFNLGVKGFAWDTTNGAANPTDAAVGTASNWDKVVQDNKAIAGIRITSM